MKGKIMNVNSILNSSIKVLMITTLVIALCISAIFIFPPIYVHAVSSDFVSVPFYDGDLTVQNIKDNGEFLLTYSSFDYYACTNNSSDVYACFVGDNTSGQIYFLTEGIDSGKKVRFSETNSRYNASTFSSNSSSAGIYYINSGSNLSVASVSNLSLTTFSTIDDAIASFGTSSGVSFERTITIKPGYVAYVQTDGGTLDLVAQFHEYSRFSRPLWDNGVRISFNGGLVPTSGTTFGSSYGSSVDWLKVASAPSNIMGQTMVGGRFYDAGLPEAGSNKCVVIYNPAYNNANTLIGGGTIDIGPTLTATFSNLVDVSLYALRADATVSYASGASITSGSDNSYNTPYVYVPSENDTSSVVSDSDYRLLDLTTNTSSPAITITAGGSNATADYGSTVAPEEAEKGLVGLLTRILQFLASPIEHVMNLFTAGGNFMSWLGQLWVWLPSDVGAILVDALIVLVVIGAIKFLWK